MEKEIFTLCDFAQESSGKLTVIGSFDAISAGQVPFLYPHCSIAAKLRFSAKEAGKHKGHISFKGPKGTPVIPNINFEPNVVMPPGAEYSTAHIVLNFGNIQIREFGKYRIELFIDDDWTTGLTLSVNKPA